MKIFDEAFKLLLKEKIEYKTRSKTKLFYEVAGVSVYVDLTKGTKLNCSCKNCSVNGNDKGLCSFRIALITHITNHRGKIDENFEYVRIKPLEAV